MSRICQDGCQSVSDHCCTNCFFTLIKNEGKGLSFRHEGLLQTIHGNGHRKCGELWEKSYRLALEYSSKRSYTVHTIMDKGSMSEMYRLTDN